MINSIAIGSDHRGFDYKERIKNHYGDVIDCGAYDADRSDYPRFAQCVVEKVLSEEVNGGILLCGSGVGMTIAANRFFGIYAAVAWNPEVAQCAREDDWCNILVLPADFISYDVAIKIIEAWRIAEPKNGRYLERILMVDQLEQEKI